MRDYIPDLTERFPEGFGGVDMYESRDPWDNFDMEDGGIPYENDDESRMIKDESDGGFTWVSLEKFYEYWFRMSPCDDVEADEKAFSDYWKQFLKLRTEASALVARDDWEGVVSLANKLAELEDSASHFVYKEIQP